MKNRRSTYPLKVKILCKKEWILRNGLLIYFIILQYYVYFHKNPVINVLLQQENSGFNLVKIYDI